MTKTINFVAEGCCNHCGSLDIAKKMTKAASECGVDYIKWQKRNPIESIPKKWHNKPHPDASNSFGQNYLEHRKFLEFTLDQHKELKYLAKSLNIGYACSVWDITSAKEIISIEPDFIKIPSAANFNFKLIKYILEHCDCKVHISLGMLKREDRNKVIDFLKKYISSVVVYHTTTEYPCPFENLFLKEILNLSSIFDEVGYSGHNYGIAADIVPLAYGATWFERHFTLDRTMKGSDQSASLEQAGLSKLCRDLINVKKSLQYKGNTITKKELEHSDKLRTYNPY